MAQAQFRGDMLTSLNKSVRIVSTGHERIIIWTKQEYQATELGP